MDDLLATNPVAPLPLGILSFNQRLTDVVITYLDSKAEAELAFRFKQSTALGKLIAVLLMGVYGLQGINSQQPVLGLLFQVGVLLLLFGIGLKSNLKSLLKIDPQASTRGLVGMAVPWLRLLPDEGDGEHKLGQHFRGSIHNCSQHWSYSQGTFRVRVSQTRRRQNCPGCCGIT